MERWAPPPESCQPHVPPYPPPGPCFTVLWRGLGGQRRLSTPLIRKVCGLAVSCPFSKKDPMVVIMMAKGPWSHGPCAPSIHLYLTHSYCSAAKSKERQSLEGETDQKPNQKRQNQRAKAKRGFWGVGARLAYPHSNTPPQPQPKNPKVK